MNIRRILTDIDGDRHHIRVNHTFAHHIGMQIEVSSSAAVRPTKPFVWTLSDFLSDFMQASRLLKGHIYAFKSHKIKFFFAFFR